MLKGLKDNSKSICTGLIVILSGVLVSGWLYFYAPAIVTTIFAYSAGVIIFGFLLKSMYRMGGDEAFEMVEAESQSYINKTAYETMAFNKKNTIQKAEQLNSVADLSNLYAEVTDVFCGFFHSSTKKHKSNAMLNELNAAISRCKDETDNQNCEVKIITSALEEFNQEAWLLSKVQKEKFISTQGDVGSVTEQINVTETRNKAECTRLLEDLRMLTENYPKSTYRENPGIDSVEEYAEARRVHHTNILYIAEVLLPNLSSLMNEARSTQNTQTGPSSR